jgi:FecR protein
MRVSSGIRRCDVIRYLWLAAAAVGGIAAVASAAELKEARVTQVVNDVKLLPTAAAPRPAAVSDEVRDGTAVRTGGESRSELKFTDQTLARLGANTIFSFSEGTRNLNLQDGAMLLRVPKGSGGAKINSSAVTAAITGTTVMVETHPLTKKNKNSFYKFIVLEGTARLFLQGQLGESVLVKAGQMIIMPLGAKKIPEAVDVDIQKIMQSSLLITGFGPLGSEQLIAFEQTKQSEQKTSGQLYETNLVIYGGGTNVVLADPNTVDTAVTAQKTEGSGPFATPPPTPTSTPTPTATPTPTSTPTATPTATPSKFGTPSPITSPVPYVLTSGTTITTDPAITTNGVTDFGKIYRGTAIDGPASAWAFGSTSTFDTSSGFDNEITDSGAAFKFTALELAGNPTISTANGEINLGLIAVNGITSGSPGGPLTFSGIRGLLLATQNGSIDLGSEISFSGLHDITFYARGAGSMLTLGCDVSTTSKIRLYGEGGIQLTSNLSTQDLIAFTGSDFDFNSGSVTAGTLAVTAGANINIGVTTPVMIIGSEASLLIPNSGTGSIPGNSTITLNPAGNLTLNGANGLSLTIDNSNGGHIGQSALILLEAADLTAGSLNLFVNNRNGGSIGSVANVACNILGNLTIAGDANIGTSNRNDGLGGGTMGTDSFVTVQANSISVGGFLSGFVSANAGGHIGNVASLQFNATGDIHSGGGTSLLVQGTAFNTPNGPPVAPGFIGSDALLNVSASNVSSDGFLDAEVGIMGGGHVGGNANLSFNIAGGIAAAGPTDSVGGMTFFVGGSAGTIGGDAAITVNAASIASQASLFFTVADPNGGTIGGNAAIDVTATNLSGNSLVAQINNTGGTIGGNAVINMNVSGASTVATNATFQILGSDGAKTAAININGGNYNVGVGVGGTFLGNIDGNGTFTLNNATIAADIVKVGVFGTNGILRINGGSISANTLLHLYAPSGPPNGNGMIDFVANTMLDSSGTAAVIAANAVTIENGVTVTIVGSTSANVYTNFPNYSARSGGNNSTSGRFVGTVTTQPLGGQPGFDSPSARVAAKQIQSVRLGGEGTGPTIHVTDSSQVSSLLENGTPDRDGKVRIAAASLARNSSAAKTPAKTSPVSTSSDRRRSQDRNVDSRMVASRLP